MPEFRMKIPNERTGSYQLINLIIVLINLFLFILVAISNQDKLSFVAYFGALLNAIATAWSFKFRKKNPGSRMPFFFLLINAVCWFTLQRWLAGILMLVFAVMEYYINRHLEIIIDDGSIRYPSFPPKIFHWKDVEQIIMKDGILTIDMKDNRLFQFSLPSESMAGINVDRFNEFCRERTLRAETTS